VSRTKVAKQKKREPKSIRWSAEELEIIEPAAAAAGVRFPVYVREAALEKARRRR
jgi:uncharacterized protein (DUF1778 family)